MAFSEFATSRPLLTLGIAGLIAGGGFLAYSMLAHATVDVTASSDARVVEVSTGDESSSVTVYLRNSFDQIVMVGGTRVTEEDRAAAEADAYDEERFQDHVRDANERAARERELFDLDGDGRVSDDEARRIADAVGTGSLAESDRETVIRALHDDEEAGLSGGNRVDSGVSEKERERIRNLFRDQGDDDFSGDDGDPGLDRSIFDTSGTSRSGEDDSAERERVRQLFLDQGDDAGSGRSGADGNGGFDLPDDEQERLRNLFRDQGDDSAAIPEGNDADGDQIASRPAPARCGSPRRSFLNILPEDLLFCADAGHTQPQLIDGDCPVSACILRFGESEGIDDFLGAS